MRTVALNGKLHILKNHPIHISDALIKQPIGITQINENIWRLQFMDIVLGHYDQKENKLSKMKEIVRI